VSTYGFPLIERDTSKSNYGAPVISEWRVAIDAYRTMVDFLKLTPSGMTFNASDKASMERDLERLAACVAQMDAGQRGKGVDFAEIPHIFSRLAVACMRLKLSGKLDELELDE
jgi:hypothetical protein